MTKEKNSYSKLGFFVIVGTVLLVVSLYLVGSRQNLFGSVFTLKAKFRNVSGLMKGNNVRYGGIDIGTVDEIELTDDTTVLVTMIIENKMKTLLKKNCIASVGTDGLMGNKLVNIAPQKENAPLATDGDFLETIQPIETETLFRTLNKTNENMKVISDNLRTITEEFKSDNNLWKLLSDSTISDDIRSTLVSIKQAGSNTLILTGNLKDLSNNLKNGKGIGALITDTTLAGKVNQIIVKINRVSDSAVSVTGDLGKITKKINSGKGTVGMLLNDTSFVNNLNTSLGNLKKGTVLLNEDLEGLKQSFPMKKYFRKKAKADKKKKK